MSTEEPDSARLAALRDELSKPDPSLPNVAGNEAPSQQGDEPAAPDDSRFAKYEATREVIKTRVLPGFAGSPDITYRKLGEINFGKISQQDWESDFEHWKREADAHTNNEVDKARSYLFDKHGDNYEHVERLIIEKAIARGANPMLVLHAFAEDEHGEEMRQVMEGE